MALIQTKGTIGRLTLKNRMIMAPMGIHNGNYTEATAAFYEERIKGGVAMIMCNTMVTDEFEDTSASMLLTQDKVSTLKEICRVAHENRCFVCPQLMPGCGRVGGPAEKYGVPVSASACSWFHAPTLNCHELTLSEIYRILERFRDTLNLALTAGIDAVEIHAYGGYLTDQFLTACWNTRTDDYGGNLQGRMKFLLDMVQIVKEEGGDDFPLIVKYSATHDMGNKQRFRTIEEGIEMATILEKAGVSALHVDAGCYEKWYDAMPPVYFQEMPPQIKAAREIRKAVNIPVITHGRLGNVEKAEAVLEKNICDFVAVARGLLADPELPQKVIEGRTDAIRPCISCNDGCIGQVYTGKQAGCAVNPFCGYELERDISKVAFSKRILIIGAGPGGCAAALMAKKAGHTVEIWEKTSRIGGKARTASEPWMKRDMYALTKYYEVQLAMKRIHVRFFTEATPEKVKAYAPDVLIWAAGGKTLRPASVIGIDMENVYTAEEALCNLVLPAENIVIVGGGLVGVETALHFDKMGKNVTLIEMADTLLPTPPFPMNAQQLLDMLRESKIKICTGTRLKSIQKDSVLTEYNGEECRIPCEQVLLAMGYCSGIAEADKYREICKVFPIGDSVRSANIMTAVSEAYEAIRKISEED